METSNHSTSHVAPALTVERVQALSGSPLRRPFYWSREIADDTAATGGRRGAEATKVQRRYHTQYSRVSRSQSTYLYGTSVEADVAAGLINTVALPIDSAEDVKKIHVKQSKPIPSWVWFILAKTLGIKLHPLDKPWFGTFMYVLTLGFAILYIITSTWYTVYDILSVRTKQTVLTGSLSVVGVIYWCTLGIYANKLASKLFSNQRFVNIVRMHSKTFFKISAAVILIFLGILETVINNVQNQHMLAGDHCGKVSVDVTVCRLMFAAHVGYSSVMLLWNLLVGIVLLSVCRTHTIGIRRFIKELEEDGRNYEQQRRHMLMSAPFSDSCRFYNNQGIDLADEYDQLDLDDDQSEMSDNLDYEISQPGQESSIGPHQTAPPRTVINKMQAPVSSSSPHNPRRNASSCLGNTSNVHSVQVEMSGKPANTNDQQTGVTSVVNPPIITVISEEEPNTDVDKISLQSNHSNMNLIQPDPPSQVSRSSMSQADSNVNSTRVEVASPNDTINEQASSLDNTSFVPNILTNEDILMSYWKISARLRWSSQILQRWLMAWIVLIILFSCSYIVYWIKHEATLLGIIEFLVPILTLPLICCAYGEVNHEGQRMLKCICPMEERVSLLFYLNQSPLTMTAFGFTINYSTIVGVLGALAVAFSTRIILEEINM